MQFLSHRITRLSLPASVLMAASILGGCAASPTQGSYEVAEVGSFHVGGRQVTLAGLPSREIVFTEGAAPRKVDPNGDFEPARCTPSTSN